MKHAWVYCGLIVLLLLGSWRSAAALRCEHRVVSSGDSPAEVLFKCGPPTVQRQRDEEIEVFDSVFINGRRVLVTRRMIVPVEVWTYNFGPHDLLYELIFRYDRVVHIRTRGYGY
jgi:Protein of unknown function (DUF2845)